MIYIFCALYEEAKHIIKTEKLKIISTDLGFSIYENPDISIRLIITGTGEIKAAIAVGAVTARYSPTVRDILINFGSASGGCEDLAEIAEDGTADLGKIYLINKITEKCTSHTYYPDVLIKHPFDEAEIMTVSTPISNPIIVDISIPTSNPKNPKISTPISTSVITRTLYDMEAAAIYQAAIHFFSPDRMYFFKTISDNGDLRKLTPEKFSLIMRIASERLMQFYKELPALNMYTFDKYAFDKYAQEKNDFDKKLSDLFMCSETMKNMLINYIKYSKNAGIDYQAIIKSMLETGLLPASSRKDGKKALENLRIRLLRVAPSTKNIQNNKKGYLFSHIYVEKNILDFETTKSILSQFSDSKIIVIDNYKDIFCRKNQNVHKQSRSRALILSETRGTNVYKGAPVCQSFGNKYFYYTSCVMNCIYDCEYCYLKGMYPSGHIVINVNIEAIYEEVKSILKKHDAYICVSYDTDLLALENLTGFVKSWINFTKEINANSDYHNLKIEIRTKCGRTDLWDTLPSDENVIFAFTLSPQTIIDLYEDKTSSEVLRINSAKKALEKNFGVRLCIDPIIYHPDWRALYGNLIDNFFNDTRSSDITDISVGSFRISQDYLKNMRKSLPDSQLVWFPFENENKVYHYPSSLMREMEDFVVERLSNYVDSNKVFRWDN